MNQLVSPAAVRPLVDDLLDEVLAQEATAAESIHPNYGHFWKMIQKAVLAGGKRFRPYLTVVAYGRIDEDIIKIAAAQELIHCAMLVHDDVIDKDLIRRGQKNISGHYIDTYSQQITDPSDIHHFANSAAILAGDALISESYQMIYQTSFSDSIKKAVSQQLGTSIYEVIAGELMDVEASFYKTVSFDPISIYRYKTASYSLIGPLLAGAYCAKRDDKTIQTLEQFATRLGIAFQIQDDLLGLYGDTAETGKSTTSDLREGKRTLLVASHELMMDQVQKSRFDQIFGRTESTEDQFESLKNDITASGARARTEEYVAEYYDDAKHYLDKLSDKQLSSQLEQISTSLRERAY